MKTSPRQRPDNPYPTELRAARPGIGRLAWTAAICVLLVAAVRAPSDDPAAAVSDPAGSEVRRAADVDMNTGRILNLGLVDTSETGGFTAAPYRAMAVSAGQLTGVDPETGLPLTAYYQLLPLMVRSLSAADGVDAVYFSGDGSMLSNLNAGAISAGRLPAAVLPGTGTWEAGGMAIKDAEIYGVKELHIDGRFSAGVETTVVGENAAAFGERSTAQGTNSAAFGMNTRAIGGNSVAFGQGTRAPGTNSAVFGAGSAAPGNRSIASGDKAVASGHNSAAFNRRTKAKGVNSAAFGNESWAEGPGSVAFGRLTRSAGTNTATFGSQTRAGKNNSAAFGSKTKATGNASLATGRETTASGLGSAAFGIKTVAWGTNSVAFGVQTKASKNNSAAFGRLTVAGGHNSVAFGDQSRAGGVNSAAFGFDTRAGGGASVAVGRQTIAGGARSFAGGQLARAQHANSFVWSDGTKETPYNDGDYIVSSRMNEFTVYASGGIRLLGGPVTIEPAGDLSMGAFIQP